MKCLISKGSIVTFTNPIKLREESNYILKFSAHAVRAIFFL